MIGGIAVSHWRLILDVIGRHPNIDDVRLFGSRAKGNFRPGSDIDLALMGRGIRHEQLTRIDADYELLYLPWKLDLVVYETISEPALRAHIDRVGVSLRAHLI